jgi:hypothetical protein
MLNILRAKDSHPTLGLSNFLPVFTFLRLDLLVDCAVFDIPSIDNDVITG